MATPRLPSGLIVNADDLGIHPNINAGIASAFHSGILTSCTMLFTTPFLEETVLNYVRPNVLPIGLHLSLTLGKTVAGSDRVPDLVDADGNLVATARQLLTCSFSTDSERLLLEQIRREFEAQLSLAHDWGLRSTHADSHQHVHMNPAIFAVVEELLPRYGIGRLRFSREPLSLAAARGLVHPRKLRNIAKWLLLQRSSWQIQPRLATSDAFFGILHSGAMTKSALATFLAVMSKQRSVEISVHPGFCAPAGEAAYPQSNYNDFISSPIRQAEHDNLIDLRIVALVRRRGIALRSYDGRLKE